MIPNNLFQICQDKCDCWPNGSIHCKGDNCKEWNQLTKEEKAKVDNTGSPCNDGRITGRLEGK